MHYEDFDHVAYVNEAIDQTGVMLSLDEDHASGKGILVIKYPVVESADSTFTIVSVSRSSIGSLIIVSEVPTNEGTYILISEVKDGKQRSTFMIKNWPATIRYQTTFSKVTLASTPNNAGIISGKIEYKGKRDADGEEIHLSSEFYFKS